MTTHAFDSMGTVVSLTFHSEVPPPAVLAEIEAEFARFDQRFSLYRADSELSLVAAGTLALPGASPQLREAYALAMEWHVATSGAFTPHRPDGVTDLSGVVKALAIDAAGHLLDSHVDDWGVNVGGDILLAAEPTRSRPRTLGLVDPDDRGQLLTSIAMTGPRRACATSGSAERGDHIWTASGRAEFVQATVVADDIVTADVLATAIIAGGAGTLDLACRTWPIDVVTVDVEGGVRMTPGAVQAMRDASGLGSLAR